jgi:hypothetical protein
MTKWFIALVLVAGCTYDYQYYNAADAAPLVDGESPHGVTMRGWALHKEMTMGDNQLAGNVVNANFPATEDGAAAEYTVQVGISQTPNAIAANGPPNLRAIISWNTNGQQIERMVSVGGGTSISGSAEGVSVSLQDFSGQPANDNFAEYDVTVTVVPGVRASTSAPPTLIPLISEALWQTEFGTTAPLTTPGVYSFIGSNQVLQIEIPQGVGIQSVLVSPGADFDATAGFSPVTDILVYQYDVNDNYCGIFYADGDGFVPIHPLATTLLLKCGTLAHGHSIVGTSVKWGIEG